MVIARSFSPGLKMCRFLKFYILRISDWYLLNPNVLNYINGHFLKFSLSLFPFSVVPFFPPLNFSHPRHINWHGESDDRESGVGPRAAVCSRQTRLCCHLRAGKCRAYKTCLSQQLLPQTWLPDLSSAAWCGTLLRAPLCLGGSSQVLGVTYCWATPPCGCA